MSSRVFQSIIIQMKEATDRVIGIIDSTSNVIACSELSFVGSRIGETPVATDDDRVITGFGKTYKLLGGFGSQFDYAVFVYGEDEMARSLCILAAIAINEAKSYYDDKHDRHTFVKNIITENILPGDIYVRAKELSFVSDAPRVVFLVRQIGKADVSAIDVISNLFSDKQNAFVISVTEADIAVVMEVPENADSKHVEKLAKTIEQALDSDLSIKTVIGIGTIARHLRELADRFKEAKVAIDVGKVFESEKTIINYENLGIGRLIYHLPTTLCEMFLSEVFKKNPIDSLDQETLFTIIKFFENNLNVSETSRKLFVHRNTLVYRLEKIKKLTGLDLREFDHAIVFKVALMVKKYLNSQEIYKKVN